MALEPLHNNNNGNTSTANTCNDNSENNININTTNTTSTDIINNTTHKSVDNDSAVNEGSIVGLPVDSKSGTSSSSSDDDDDDDNDQEEEEEEDSSSADELTAAGDALCRKLMMQEQLQHNKAMSMNQHHESSAAEPINSIEEHAVKNDNDDDDDDQGRPRQSLTEVETRSTPLPLQSPSFLPALSNGDHHDSNSNNNNNDNNKSLEERVQELETKLATLSRLLQQQQRLSFRSLLARSPSNSQRSLIQQQQQQQPQPQDGFSNNNSNDDDDHHHYRRDSSESPPPTQRTSHPTPSMVPYLESPAPFDDMSPRNRSLHQRKRLSFHLLYDGNEDNLRRADDEDHHGKGRPPFHDNNTHNSTNSSIMMMEMMQHNNNDNNQHIMDNHNNCMEDPDSMVQIMEHHTNTNNNNNNNHETSDGTGHQADHSTTSNTHLENDVHPLKRSSSHENNNNINNHIITANDSQTMSIQVSQLDEQSAHEQKLHNNTIANVAARVVQQQQQQQRQVQTKPNGVDEMDVSASTLGSGNMMIKKNQQQQQQQQPSVSNHSSGTTHNSANSNTSKAAGEEFFSPTNNNNHHNNNNNNNNNASGGGDSNNNKIIKSAILPPLLLSKDKRSKWLDHLNSFQESNYDVDVQMQEFIKVPGAVERTLTSGFLICVDSFLYVCTILPIRFVWSCVLLSLHYFFRWTKKPAGNLQFHRRHTYQLVQVTIIVVIYRYVLIPISIGKLYHWIRGQAMIKLYVLIAIVEVFDRLMCSLGQDCLDSLYWNTTRRPRSSRMLISVSVVVVYTAVHSLILFVHVATLNVAMNSADEALLALLIAGNFAEIKSTVFKKYNKSSLFKIVASDICERFKLALFLGLVLLLNFCQGMDSRKMSDYQRIAGIVWMSELLCDWLKHAFITKFNFIPSTVYPEYGLLLAGDVTGIGHEGVNLDHSHAVVKRIGFAQMPLVCVMARLVREAAKYILLRIDSNAVPFFVPVLASTGCWIMLLVLKIFLGAYLQRTSLAKLHAAPELSQTPLKAKQKQQ